MSQLRIVGTRPLAVDDGAASPTAQDTQPHRPVDRHRHHAHRSTNRLRTKRRRGADAQDGIDEAGASEELQMMLNEHLQRTSDLVMRVAERRHGDRGGSEDGGHRDGDEDHDDHLGATGRAHAAATASSDSAAGSHAAWLAAEDALLAARRIRGGENWSSSSTYEILKVMLDFLSVPSAVAKSGTSLGQVRERLVQLVEAPTEPAPPQQHSSNLLLPLLMLSLDRTRSDSERARGLATLRSLVERRRNHV